MVGIQRQEPDSEHAREAAVRDVITFVSNSVVVGAMKVSAITGHERCRDYGGEYCYRCSLRDDRHGYAQPVTI